MVNHVGVFHDYAGRLQEVPFQKESAIREETTKFKKETRQFSSENLKESTYNKINDDGEPLREERRASLQSENRNERETKSSQNETSKTRKTIEKRVSSAPRKPITFSGIDTQRLANVTPFDLIDGLAPSQDATQSPNESMGENEDSEKDDDEEEEEDEYDGERGESQRATQAEDADGEYLPDVPSSSSKKHVGVEPQTAFLKRGTRTRKPIVMADYGNAISNTVKGGSWMMIFLTDVLTKGPIK